MTFSSEDGSSRGGGSILVVGGASSEFLPAVQALQSMADTTLVPPAEALAALSRLDANVLVVEDRDRQLLAEAVALRPAIVRILLRSTGQATGEAADGAADGPDAETVVLPRPLDVAALQAVCAVGEDSAHEAGAVVELADRHRHSCSGVERSGRLDLLDLDRARALGSAADQGEEDHRRERTGKTLTH